MKKENPVGSETDFHQGDIIDLDLDPRTGHEQSGYRPAVIVSRDLFHRTSGLLVVCPITSKDRKSPFHIPLTGASNTTGFVLCDQVRTIDPAARNARYRGRISMHELFEVSDTLAGMMEVLQETTEIVP